MITADLLLMISWTSMIAWESIFITHAQWAKLFSDTEKEFMDRLEHEDIELLWGIERSVKNSAVFPALSFAAEDCPPVQKPVYEASELTNKHEEFFANLMSDNDFPQVEDSFEEPPMFMDVPVLDEEHILPEPPPVVDEFGEYLPYPVQHRKDSGSHSVEKADQEEMVETDTSLCMSDWETKPPERDVAPLLSAKATHKIMDGHIGEQIWVLEVVGSEQDYIHVSDGSNRAWLHVTNDQLTKGDILSVRLHRNVTDRLEVKHVEILQKKSLDFAIDGDFEQEDHEIEFYPHEKIAF